MATAMAKYERYSRRRRRHAMRAGQRLDIQGLRMVAVLTVFANHLWGWPDGGFVGVDVFFVISGFLITGNLLRDAEKTGNVSFRRFYWNRMRRIFPAATVVLVLTVAVAYLVFMPFRAREVRIDALWAFAFVSNWWFGYEQTDYFRAAADTVSPVQHYWSLSIEEQFYVIWPALIFVIGVLVFRRAWTHARRMQLAAAAMGIIVAASLGWALYETATDAAWAYFDTAARAWELGVGALLACSVGVSSVIPAHFKPFLSWAGLALIAASLFVIHEGALGFPAPWALLPVTGAALVIAAGVGGEPKYQAFLRGPLAGYIGDVSYSLYLVHWPIIVFLQQLMAPDWRFSVIAICAGLGLAIASYHFIENPLRKADYMQFRLALRDIRKRRFHTQKSSSYAAAGCLALLAISSVVFVSRPDLVQVPTAPPSLAAAPDLADTSDRPRYGPATTALQSEIVAALKATDWPSLSPSMESAMEGAGYSAQIAGCDGTQIDPPATACDWGSPDAPTRIVVVGDSIGLNYVEALSEIAKNSNGAIQVHSETLPGCVFADALVDNRDRTAVDLCTAKKQHAVDFINATRPTAVIIANTYEPKRVAGEARFLTPDQWTQSLNAIVDKFRPSTGRVVLVAAPPQDVEIGECYGQRSSVPADCISRVSSDWKLVAFAENRYARSTDAVWLDSRPWFCADEAVCPSFVGLTPTKHDRVHMSGAYGKKISAALQEYLSAAGVL